MSKKKSASKRKANEVPGSMVAEITLSVVGYHDRLESCWTAIALEMDLHGSGQTFEAALADLMDLVRIQISFALFKGQPELISKPADPIWFHRFAEIRTERLRMITTHPPEGSDYRIRSIPIPPPHVIEDLSRNFHQADG
ncbi:MAG: hypothetical protein ACR2L2_14250 [Acidobacteriota bacterium]